MHVLIGFGRISANEEFKEIELSCFLNVCMFSFDITTFFCPRFVCVIGCLCGFVFNVYWVLVWVFILVTYMYGLIGLDMFLVVISFVIFPLLSIVLLFSLCVLMFIVTY